MSYLGVSLASYQRKGDVMENQDEMVMATVAGIYGQQVAPVTTPASVRARAAKIEAKASANRKAS